MPPTNELVISHSWYEETSHGDREFLVTADVWCTTSSRTPNSVRKPPVSRRVAEKRDSIGGQAAALEERRLREKPSWFRSHASGSSANGQWLPASCKLLDEGNRCLLNVYVGETFLQDSIYVHYLRCTDIRIVDRSLFFQGNILGLHVKSGQRFLDKDAEEHVYLKFPDFETLNTWTALLRSYAVAEIYGRRLAPSHDGGLYRMWRQVFLEVKQVRNLGSPKSFNDAVQPSGVTSDGESPNDSSDMELSCEIAMNDVLCGRTTSKKGLGSLEWHEQFTFSDLPPFGDLFIHVFREKRITKPQLVGAVHVVLPNFRRGELVEGWFPIIYSGSAVNGIQIGEMRLKIKVDEEIVLPTAAYTPILKCFGQGNMLDRLIELEQELKLEHVAEHVMAIAVVNNVLMRDLCALSEREVLSNSSSHNTLFRGNSVLTKTVELVMNLYGKSFLEASIGSAVRRLCAEKVAIEVDPVRSGKGTREHEKSVDLLVQWCGEFWNGIYAERSSCPQELRLIFHHIRQLVEQRFSDNRNMRWQSVSAFCFLRFIVPAILHPHLFGLCHGMPSPTVQRSLTLIAKVLQSLANLNPTVRKEEFMKGGLKDFMSASLPAMIDYIGVVSTPKQDSQPCPFPTVEEDERLQVMNSLRERGPNLPTLHREALLFLPHLLDLPKNLAILTSAVVRCSNQQRQSGVLAPPRSALNDLIEACNRVEEKAIQHVSRLKRPNRANVRRLSRNYPDPFISQSTSFVAPIGTPPPNASQGESLRSRARRSLSLRSGRPSTAPSGSDSASSHSTRSRKGGIRDTGETANQPINSSQPERNRSLDETMVNVAPSSYKRTMRDESPAPKTSIRMPSDETPSSTSDTLSDDGKKPNAIMRLLAKR